LENVSVGHGVSVLWWRSGGERTIGIVPARAKIGLQNLAYNIRRLVTLERLSSSLAQTAACVDAKEIV